MTEMPGSIYTKEYIAKVRLASNMLGPLGGEVVCELLDEIVRLQAEIAETALALKKSGLLVDKEINKRGESLWLKKKY